MGPANPDPNDLLSRSYFRPVLTPGSSITETVTVSNTGDVPVDLYVYPVDGLTGTTSGTVYANRADPRQKAGTWLTATVSSLTVPADHVQEVPCRIDVPATAAPGDHVAGIACDSGATCLFATNSISYPYTLPAATSAPTATKVFNSALNTGMGDPTVTVTWTLAIPGKTLAGSYTSTWTLSLVTGP